MKFIANEEQVGQRIDQVLSKRSSVHSRGWWQDHIEHGRVKINSATVGKDYRVQTGDVISFEEPPAVAIAPNPLFDQIHVIDETTDFVVIEKPSGLMVHPIDAKDPTSTLAQWIVTHYPETRRVGDDPLRPGIVHRLDKEVSGLMLVSRTQSAFEYFKMQFGERLMKKEYTALVHGVLDTPHDTINFRVGRSKRTGAMAALPANSIEGKSAVTEYEVRQQFSHATLVAVFPHTGRTHQIRVHFFALGHPLVGDSLYRSTTNSDALDERVNRIFLHSTALDFTDAYGGHHHYSSPLPDDLQSCLDTLL